MDVAPLYDGPSSIDHLLNSFRENRHEPAENPSKNHACKDAAGDLGREPSVLFVITGREDEETDFTQDEHYPAKIDCEIPPPAEDSPEWEREKRHMGDEHQRPKHLTAGTALPHKQGDSEECQWREHKDRSDEFPCLGVS